MNQLTAIVVVFGALNLLSATVSLVMLSSDKLPERLPRTRPQVVTELLFEASFAAWAIWALWS